MESTEKRLWIIPILTCRALPQKLLPSPFPPVTVGEHLGLPRALSVIRVRPASLRMPWPRERLEEQGRRLPSKRNSIFVICRRLAFSDDIAHNYSVLRVCIGTAWGSCHGLWILFFRFFFLCVGQSAGYVAAEKRWSCLVLT